MHKITWVKQDQEYRSRVGAEGKTCYHHYARYGFCGECFQRVIVLSEGQLLLDGPTREVFAKEDVLRSANLEPPYVTQLSKAMGYQGVLLSVEEFVAYYHSSIENWERRL